MGLAAPPLCPHPNLEDHFILVKRRMELSKIGNYDRFFSLL
jgi:hypothetical protein